MEEDLNIHPLFYFFFLPAGAAPWTRPATSTPIAMHIFRQRGKRLCQSG